MTRREVREHMEGNWDSVVEELIEENFYQLLENEGVDEAAIENYGCYKNLPEDLAISIWRRQEEHLGQEFEDYVDWYRGRQ